MTGESAPVAKRPGDALTGGTVNCGGGAVLMTVTQVRAVPGESMLPQVCCTCVAESEVRLSFDERADAAGNALSSFAVHCGGGSARLLAVMWVHAALVCLMCSLAT